MARHDVDRCNPLRTASGTFDGPLTAPPAPALRQARGRVGWGSVAMERFGITTALAHGHKAGAAGVGRTTRLVRAMERGAARRGVATLCGDGGQGIAVTLEHPA